MPGAYAREKGQFARKVIWYRLPQLSRFLFLFALKRCVPRGVLGRIQSTRLVCSTFGFEDYDTSRSLCQALYGTLLEFLYYCFMQKP